MANAAREAFAGQAIVAYAFGLAAPLLAGFAIWAELGWRAAVLAGVAAGIAIGLGFRRMRVAGGGAAARR